MLALARPATGGTPTLLRDINPLARAPIVDDTALANQGRVYLSLVQPGSGLELAVVQVAFGQIETIDLEPGPGGSSPDDLVAIGAKVLFAAFTSAHGRELWASDGTAAGTTVLEVRPGPSGGIVNNLVSDGALLVLDNGGLLFAANDGVHGTELWITDGTPENTLLFGDIRSGEQGSEPRAITRFPGGFLMRACPLGATSCVYHTTPFVTSGTIAGPLDEPAQFTLLADPTKVVFTSGGRQIWLADLTTFATATLLKDLPPLDNRDSPRNLRAVNGVVVFDAETPEAGRELWRTDGSAVGTVPIADLHPGAHDGFAALGTSIGTTAYVYPAFFPDAGIELAVTDGATIARLADAMPGPGSAWENGRMMTAGTRAYVALDDGVHGMELWQTDGTPSGTSLVADLLPGRASSQPRPLAVEGDTLFFLAHGPSGFGLWSRRNGPPTLVRDLSAGGTGDGAANTTCASVSDRLLFSAFDPEAGRELWATDGTPGGTERVLDLVPGFRSAFPGGLLAVGSRVFFVAADETHGRELFVSDGTAAGTHLVKDIVPGDGPRQGGRLIPRLALGERLLLSAETDAEGTEPWVSDGTEAGTTLLKDIVPGPADSFPRGFAASGDRAFFSARDPSRDRLWVTDGTPDGTRRVSEQVTVENLEDDLTPFRSGVLFGGSGVGIPDGDELWFSDGTAAGTRMVADLAPGDSSSAPRLIRAAGNRAFFVAGTAEGVGLWTTDGTPVGTTLVKAPIALSEDATDPGAEDSPDVIVLGDRAVFAVITAAGRSIWISDGTPGGTQPLTDACPLDRDCGARSLFAFEGTAFFAFDDGVHGRELWQTDGTPAGTHMVADTAPGPASFRYSPSTVGFFRGKIFLDACDDAHGCEPWILAHDLCPDDPAKLAAGDCGCGTVDADTDGSGVSDCLIPDELRARIDALIALIDPIVRPKTRSERQALKARFASIRAALAELVAYHAAHAGSLGDMKKRLRVVRKRVKGLTRNVRAVKGPRAKSLSALTALRERVPG